MRALVWKSWFIILVGTLESETNMVLMFPKRLENTKRNKHASWHKVCKFGKIFQKNTFIRGQTFYQSNKEGTLRGASAWLRISIVDLFSSPAWRYKMLLPNWASWLQDLWEDPQKTKTKRWYWTLRSQVSTIIIMRCKIVMPAGSQRGKSSITGHSKSHVEL